MEKRNFPPISYFLFLISLAFIIYMPLHVFIAQSVSLLTGGLDAWKAAKDVLLFAVGPFLLYISYKRGLWSNKTFRLLLIFGTAYALLHGLFLLLDSDDDAYSTVVASVYNTRILGFLLLGFLVGSVKEGKRWLQYLFTAAVLIATIVSVFGLLQYFVLPHDFLEQFGYTVERGVKPFFFIDDKPDLPRIMATVRDPNSFGAFLILPIITLIVALFKKGANKELFVRPFQRHILWVFLVIQGLALLLTFSRGSLIAFVLSLIALAALKHRSEFLGLLRRHMLVLTGVVVFLGVGFLAARDTYFVENVVYHADESTVQTDPNQLRIELYSVVIDDVLEQPIGYGPGTAGLVSINNPKGTLLTENYYLQIAYEVGWIGVALFIVVLATVIWALARTSQAAGQVLLVSLVGYLFYSLLIHLWSNEAVALQWWLLAGVVIGIGAQKSRAK